MIEPIGEQIQDEVIAATDRHIALAGTLFGRNFAPLEVVFDLKGRAAGMYRIRSGQRQIRYNPYLFAKYFEDNLTNTVSHEVAHYIVDQLYGLRRVRPHGVEWKNIMKLFGVEPVRTSEYDIQGIPCRSQKYHSYRCECTHHELSGRRHGQVISGKRAYYCRKCRAVLRAA